MKLPEGAKVLQYFAVEFPPTTEARLLSFLFDHATVTVLLDGQQFAQEPFWYFIRQKRRYSSANWRYVWHLGRPIPAGAQQFELKIDLPEQQGFIVGPAGFTMHVEVCIDGRLVKAVQAIAQ